MAKFTKKEIRVLIDCTPKKLKGVQISNLGYETRDEIGIYHPSTANWSYVVYALAYKGRAFQVVTRFGEII